MSLRAGGEDSPEGTPAPGQVHSPPGAWPGAPATSHGWQAGEDTDDVVTGPLPDLRHLASRFSSRLSVTERVGFLLATVNRGGLLEADEQRWTLEQLSGRLQHDEVIVAALEGFCAGLAAVISNNDADQEAPTT